MTSPLKTDLTDEDRLNWLRLIRTESVGPITFYRLMARFGTAEKALEMLPDLSRKGGRKRAIQTFSKAAAEKELNALARHGGKIITVADPEYPLALSAVEDAPPVLLVLGNADLLNSRCVAIVGARNASHNGCRFAETLARELGEAGFTIASGMARGVDTAAHKGSVPSGTIAVIAGGIDIIYPQENAGLYDQIRQNGLIVAENAFGFHPRPQDFPRRNRIVSGISEGVIIAEASLRSGSLITARLAAEQGREVFAVPGFPQDPRAQGPNKLIRDGATLIQSAQDVIQALSGFRGNAMREPAFDPYSYTPFDDEELAGTDEQDVDRARIILEGALSSVPSSIDDLIRAHDLTVPEVQNALLELELAGRLLRHAGGRVSLAG